MSKTKPGGKPGKTTLRDQHAEATRAALVLAAVARFSAHGHAGTSLDDIAADVGTTKGAVYHHFKDKKALFAAAYEHLSQALITELWKQPEMASGSVYGAIHAFLTLAPQRGYSRVLFVEGPVVLGAAVCRDIDLRHGLGLMEAMVAQHTPPKLLKEVGTEVLTRMLLAQLIEAVQLISTAADPARMATQVEQVLKLAIGALSRPSSRA